MAARKYNKTEPLSRIIGVRVSEAFYAKMEGWMSQSNCATVAEFARHMLLQEQIIWFHKDATLDGVAAELAAIRRELNGIGNNINQVTRYFNSTAVPSDKMYHALKILDDYRRVGQQVQTVLTKIADVKWSPK